nr:helix-turn-helix domain-containing protein [uncultured Carboxylicivirga sp.]
MNLIRGAQKVAEKSIAVLPFMNISNDEENEYFSDGVTEEIINALTKIEELKVIARTSSFSFKGKHIDIREIARQLGVAAVLEGSVRRYKNRVRITAQLINADDGAHFWSQNFDRELEDIFALQDEISLLIADKIRENYGHFNIQDHLVSTETKSIKAYELYLKGHFFQLKWDPDSIKKAADYYKQSIKHDEGFARSYYGLVQAYGLLAAWGYMPSDEGFAIAIDYFMIAQDLNKSLPEYGQSFVGRTFWMEWDFKSTYKQLIETLELHPKYTDGLEAMAELFIAHGKWAKAEEYIKRAMEVDPMSANHFYTQAHICYFQKDFEQALQYLNQALFINPDFVLAYEVKTLCLIWLNRQDEFELMVAERKDADLKRTYFDVINDGNITLKSDQIDEWSTAVSQKAQMVPYELFIMANSNYKSQALQLLHQYIDQKRGQVINYHFDPSLEALHVFDEFHQLYQSNLIDELNEANREIEPASNPLNADQHELQLQMKKLEDFIDTAKPYLDPQLSLAGLADAVQFHPNKLSFLINIQTQMNFNEFINQYRLNHFKLIAKDNKYAHLTIIGLAYESGFNSKSVFNAYFKKATGTTPGSWLKQNK